MMLDGLRATFDDDIPVAERRMAVQAASQAARDMLTVSSLSLANVTLARRDAVLTQEGIKGADPIDSCVRCPSPHLLPLGHRHRFRWRSDVGTQRVCFSRSPRRFVADSLRSVPFGPPGTSRRGQAPFAARPEAVAGPSNSNIDDNSRDGVGEAVRPPSPTPLPPPVVDNRDSLPVGGRLWHFRHHWARLSHISLG